MKMKPAEIARIRAVSFDLTGTLIHTAEPVGRVYARLAGHHGIAVTADEMELRFVSALAKARPLAFGPLAPDELRNRERAWWREIVTQTIKPTNLQHFEQCFSSIFSHYANPSAWRLAPEAKQTLCQLRALGLKTLIISNFDSRALGIISGTGLGRLLDQVTISSAAGVAKPNPEIFHLALKQVGLPAHEVVHVGDSVENDFLAARAVGLEAVYVTTKATAAAQPLSPAISSLPEILSLISKSS